MTNDEQFFSERRAAARVGVSRSTLRRHRNAGRIQPLMMGFVVLYPLNALLQWRREFAG
jgi:hypothetical protein